MKESTFSFWENAEFGALVDQPFYYEETDWNLSQEENQAQQWFFEAWGDNGYVLSVKISSKNWGKMPCKVQPIIQVMVLSPDEEVGQDSKEYQQTDFVKLGDQLNFQLGQNKFTQEGNSVTMNVVGEGISLNLSFTGVIDPWKPGNGKVAYADKGKKYCHWLVPMPKAKVSGKINFKEQEIDFNGTGYYDYWDANFPIGEILREARKGRFFGSKGTFIFSKFKGKSLYSFKPVYAYLFAWEDQVIAKGPHFDGKFTGQELIFMTRDRQQAELKLKADYLLPSGPWFTDLMYQHSGVKGLGRLIWKKTLPEYDEGIGICEKIML